MKYITALFLVTALLVQPYSSECADTARSISGSIGPKWDLFAAKVNNILKRVQGGTINKKVAIGALTALGISVATAAVMVASTSMNQYERDLLNAFKSRDIENIIDVYHAIKNGEVPLAQIDAAVLDKAKAIAISNNDDNALIIANDLLNAKLTGTYYLKLDTIIRMQASAAVAKTSRSKPGI